MDLHQLPALFFQPHDEDGAGKEKKCSEVPESLKHPLPQEAAVITLDYPL